MSKKKTPTWNDPNATDEANKYQNPIPSRLLILQTVAQMNNDGKPATAESLGLHFEILGDDERFLP